MVGAEAHTVFAQTGAGILVEGANVFQNVAAVENAEIFHQAEGKTTGQPGQAFIGGHAGERRQNRINPCLQPLYQPRIHGAKGWSRQVLVGKNGESRLERLLAGHEPGDRFALPAQIAVRGEHECAVLGFGELLGPLLDRRRQRLLGRGAHGFGFSAFGLGVGRKAEAEQSADMLALDHDVAGCGDLGFQHRILLQTAHQHTGAPVNKAFCQPLMKRVGKRILHTACLLAPIGRIGKPVRLVCDKCPGADMGNPCR